MSVTAVGVSSTRSTTSAVRQPSPRTAVGASVAPEALLTPGVSVVVVAEGLPEAHLVALHDREAPYPLGALPEVEVRHEQPRRTAVLGLERAAVEVVRDPCLAARDGLHLQVGRVAAVGEGGDVCAAHVEALEQRVHRHALPGGLELRPSGHAVDVPRDRLRGQGLELLPRPGALRLDRAAHLEAPLGERGVWRGAGGEDGEVLDHVLAGRNAIALGLVASAAAEAAAD